MVGVKTQTRVVIKKALVLPMTDIIIDMLAGSVDES